MVLVAIVKRFVTVLADICFSEISSIQIKILISVPYEKLFSVFNKYIFEIAQKINKRLNLH